MVLAMHHGVRGFEAMGLFCHLLTFQFSVFIYAAIWHEVVTVYIVTRGKATGGGSGLRRRRRDNPNMPTQP